MRWTVLTLDQKNEKFEEEVKKLCEWRKVFVLWPVEVSPSKYVWLERIYRRGVTYDETDRISDHVKPFKRYYSRIQKLLSRSGFRNSDIGYYRMYWEYKTDVLEMLKD